MSDLNKVAVLNSTRKWTDASGIKLYQMYEELCNQTQSEQLCILFHMDHVAIYNEIRHTANVAGTWLEDDTYVYVDGYNAIIITRPCFSITLSQYRNSPIYSVTQDLPRDVIVSQGLIPALKALLGLLNIEVLSDTSVDETLEAFSEHLKQQIPIKMKKKKRQLDDAPAVTQKHNALPANLLAAKFDNPLRVGKNRRHSKKELVDVLKPYVPFDENLSSLFIPENELWNKLRNVDLETIDFDTDDAIVVPTYAVGDNEITTVKLIVADWHVILKPNKTSVNSLYRTFSNIDANDTKDLANIAAVISTVTKMVNG